MREPAGVSRQAVRAPFFPGAVPGQVAVSRCAEGRPEFLLFRNPHPQFPSRRVRPEMTAARAARVPAPPEEVRVGLPEPKRASLLPRQAVNRESLPPCVERRQGRRPGARPAQGLEPPVESAERAKPLAALAALFRRQDVRGPGRAAPPA